MSAKVPTSGRLVPDGFSVPAEHVADGFRLVPLGPEHNAADYAASTSSIDHIRATPAFAGQLAVRRHGAGPEPGRSRAPCAGCR